MFKEFGDFLKLESYKAKRLSIEVDSTVKEFTSRLVIIEKEIPVATTEFKPFDELATKRKFIKLYRKMYAEIFKQTILDADFKSIEYTRKWRFFTHLAGVVDKGIDSILESLITYGYAGARETMEYVAGDFNDFMEGVEVARKIIDSIKEHVVWERDADKERDIRVWRDYVWPNDKYYDRTVEFRFSAWGDKAPYWVLLDEGNDQYKGVFPKFTATNFFYEACQKVLIDLNERVLQVRLEHPAEYGQEVNYKYELQQLTVRVSDLINSAVLEFIENPTYYQPGMIFNKYKDTMNGFMYKIYVTPGRRVGVRKI